MTATTETARLPCVPVRSVRVLRRWGVAAAVLVPVVVSLWSLSRAPHASWQPVALGMVPWLAGKYLLCPLRWHALSCSGRSRRWHLRVYAESEMFGLASPGHVGADLWRVHRLRSATPMHRPAAVAEVALDRLVGALGLTVFVVLSGASLPGRVLVAAVGVAALVLVGALVARRVRPELLAERPLPRPGVLLRGMALSIGYQVTLMCLLFGDLEALGQEVHPLALLGVFGAAQVAGIVPGVNGASPKDGALVVGLTSLGVSWSAALGAVALASMVAWGPALVLGGASLAAARWRRPSVLA